MSNTAMDILKRAEIKRVAENVTKKELVNILGINYNFYTNCIIGRNLPSAQMLEKLIKYLETPTQEVYENIFAFRSSIYNTNRSVKRNENMKEEFHHKLNISKEEYKTVVDELKRKNIYKEPKLTFEL